MYQELVERLNAGRFTKLKWARFKAVLNCLTLQDACRCTLEMLAASPDQFMRDAFCQKLTVDITREGWQPCHEALCRQLLVAWDDLDTQKKQQHADILTQLAGLTQTPATLRKEIAQPLLAADKIGIRRGIYRALEEVELTNIIEDIERAWLTYGDKACASLIVKRCPVDIQERHFASLGATGNKQITIPLFLNVELTPERLATLKKTDGITYAYVCAKRGIACSNEEAAMLWAQHAEDEQAGLLLWCFGQMKLRDFLTGLQFGPKKRPSQQLTSKKLHSA